MLLSNSVQLFVLPTQNFREQLLQTAANILLSFPHLSVLYKVNLLTPDILSTKTVHNVSKSPFSQR